MKSIISYFAVFISAILYMLLFDKAAGGIMTVFLFVTPVISIFLTVSAKKRIIFELECDNEILNKGKLEKIHVNITKDTILPLPFICFTVELSKRFCELAQNVYKFSMSENRELTVDIDVNPKICGPADICINKIYITDYLGIFKFKINPDMLVCKTVSISPDIVEIDESNELLRNIFSSLTDNDDDDASKSGFGKSSFPGYEYRNYVPGDSLKKINWKLSSKRNQLFVRLDEASNITLPDIFLDTSEPVNVNNEETAMYTQQTIIEASLSLLMMFVRQGLECTYSYYDNGILKKESFNSPDGIQKLADNISSVNFNNISDYENINTQSHSSKSTGVNIVYTLNINNQLINRARSASDNNNAVKIIIPENTAYSQSAGMSDVWLIKENYEICRFI